MTRDHQQVLEEFKYKGFFSEYLPKNFNLESDKIDLFNLDFSEKSDFIEPLKFTMSRFTNDEQRRMIYLPELTNYLILLKYMAENNIISELINFSQENDNSFSKILHKQWFDIKT